MTIGELNERFGIDGVAAFDAGRGGLSRLRIGVGGAEAEVYLQGAHLTHWAPVRGRPVLWMSAKSRFEAGAAIRGGVPICWPWFGPHERRPELGNHGFVRRMPWEVESVLAEDEQRVAVTLAVGDTAATREQYPHAFTLRLTIVVGPELTMTLEACNTSGAGAAGAVPEKVSDTFSPRREKVSDTGIPGVMRFSEAFHPYLAVADVWRAEVRGLEGLAYVDLRDGSRHVAGGGPLRFTEVTDREYIQTQAACELLGAAHWRRLLIAKSGSNSTVVWNPWAETATRMPDFGPDEWPGMLCIEPSNAATVDSVTLAPGAAHAMTATISVSD